MFTGNFKFGDDLIIFIVS